MKKNEKNKLSMTMSVRRKICKYVSIAITAGFGLSILSTLGLADLGKIGILEEVSRLAVGLIGFIGFGLLTAVISTKINEIEHPKPHRIISNKVAVITVKEEPKNFRKMVI